MRLQRIRQKEVMTINVCVGHYVVDIFVFLSRIQEGNEGVKLSWSFLFKTCRALKVKIFNEKQNYWSWH